MKKNELRITYHFFFDLNHCQLLKTRLLTRPFRKPCCVYESFKGKIVAYQLSNCVAYWNTHTNLTSKLKTVT